MSKHTPGPWKADQGIRSQAKLVYINILHGKDRVSSASVYGHKTDGSPAGKEYVDRYGDKRQKPVISAEECRANARLIAAAPDLLEALEKTLTWLTSYPGNGAITAYDQARAAIAKAAGQQT